jgi:riboflavin kinase/FMN adenylyltransferase
MSVTEEISALVSARGCVACIGVFDGVHKGHQALLTEARVRAQAKGLPVVAVTFDPHPMSVVRHRSAPTSLAALPRRVQLLHDAGADAVHVLEFDEQMAQMSPEDFVERVLVQDLHVREVVVGEDFRFGHRAEGTVETLRQEGSRLGFDVTAVPLRGDESARWSSTYARGLVQSGEVAQAAEVLGRPYGIDGTVVHGDHRGRDLGFPTANVQWPDDPTLPADGVYAGWLVRRADRWPAAISVGTNPQFNGSVRRIEAYALDRTDLDLYGHRVEVEFVKRIRGQETFADLAAFIERMHADVAVSREILSGR